MDPAAPVPSPAQEGFPRPRGDGPEPRGRRPALTAVSPPTRGWTHRGIRDRPCAPGFPAHAGMDPHHAAQPPNTTRFPRPRGDGPHPLFASSLPLAVSPPTRGWTCHSYGSKPDGTGFPAHAGMDPSHHGPLIPKSRFPRPRGDGPEDGGGTDGRLEVSPPTRGWTPYAKWPKKSARGFPAHAGMDHGRAHRATAQLGFPRPRGDGPPDTSRMPWISSVSPPTRGWTAKGRPHGGGRPGFPAHAGMDLRRGSTTHAAGGFPRPRGDGPQGHHWRHHPRQVSPPTRGWTRLPTIMR